MKPTIQQKARILVVEDDLDLTSLIHDVFNDVGYEVITVSDVDNIVALVDQVQPHVVLLDYLLPNSNGGELCMQIKQEERMQTIPVIISSGLSNEQVSPADYGCDSFLSKPFELDELIRLIEKALRGHKISIH